jgi:L-serine/L-threonine ammonia-lyase
MQGLSRHGWTGDVTVIAVETEGADCLSKAIQAGRQVTLPKITSIAKSLGVSRISSKTLDLYQRHSTIQSVVLSDAEAARACVRFANEQKMMVEPACGVSLAMCYNGLLKRLVPGFSSQSRVLMIVCGGTKTPKFSKFEMISEHVAKSRSGSNMDLNTLQEYDLSYGSHPTERETIVVNGMEL